MKLLRSAASSLASSKVNPSPCLIADFLASAPDLADYPAGDKARIPLAGRSNAGESSVLNRLAGLRLPGGGEGGILEGMSWWPKTSPSGSSYQGTADRRHPLSSAFFCGCGAYLARSSSVTDSSGTN